MTNWVSPLLGIRFDWVKGEELVLLRPDGQRFLSSVELDRRLQIAEQRANRLADRLRAIGINPDSE